MPTPRKILLRDYAADRCCVCGVSIVRIYQGALLPRDEVERELRGCQVRMHAGACQEQYEEHHGTAEQPLQYVPLRDRRRSDEFNQ